MQIITEYIQLHTESEIDIINISDDVRSLLSKSGLQDGQVTIFVPGSTGGISTVEYEPGLLKDIPEFWEQIAPAGKTYHHNETWHDGNGHAHVRATLTKPDLTVPFVDGQLTLGTWQQIIFLDYDVPARNRKLVVQFIGE